MVSYVYGKNVGKQMVESDITIKKVYLSKKLYDQFWHQIIKEKNLSYEITDDRKLGQLSSQGNHQGIVLEIADYPTYSLEELLASIPPTELGLIVLLDGITDPQNLGAILRNCDGAGASGVIIPKQRSTTLNATVAKVSSGAISSVKVSMVTNLVQTIKQLKKQGYWIAGCDALGSDIYGFDFSTPLVLVIGSESKGISKLVKENCDYLISIPMRGKVTSLNAAAASAVALYQIVHQRSLSKTGNGENEKVRK